MPKGKESIQSSLSVTSLPCIKRNDVRNHKLHGQSRACKQNCRCIVRLLCRVRLVASFLLPVRWSFSFVFMQLFNHWLWRWDGLIGVKDSNALFWFLLSVCQLCQTNVTTAAERFRFGWHPALRRTDRLFLWDYTQWAVREHRCSLFRVNPLFQPCRSDWKSVILSEQSKWNNSCLHNGLTAALPIGHRSSM